MSKRLLFFVLGAAFIIFPTLLLGDFPAYSDSPYNSSNPFSFSVPEPPGPLQSTDRGSGDGDYGDFFMVWDLNLDGLPDFIFRSNTKLYAYDHDGTAMWPTVSIDEHTHTRGASFAILDTDGDGDFEIVAVNTDDQLVIVNGNDGSIEKTVDVTVGSNQTVGYVVAVNLQDRGDREVIVQTVDVETEGHYAYYINRNVIAIDLSTSPATVLWTVSQDRDLFDGEIYDGYWGQVHGGLICADVDNDGLDEVVGGNYIDDDGTEMDLSYSTSWIATDFSDFIDHLDAVAIGDFRPDLPGLEWVVTEEDHIGKSDWHTTMLNTSSVLWSQETSLFSDTNNDREPQNIAVGNFDASVGGNEVWARSRFGDGYTPSGTSYSGQHPWMFDSLGTELSSNHYDMEDVLPSGFFDDDNQRGDGIETIWTIDWAGTEKEYIAGEARHADAHVGVFDATDGRSVFNTISFGNVDAKNVYVADIAGDSREEIILYDSTDQKIKVFWNTDSNTDNKPNKWDDPLYKRLKQNWSYYSPGSYTQRNPVLLSLNLFLEGPYSGADTMNSTLRASDYIPNASPYTQDLKAVASFPSAVVDWILVELRSSNVSDTIAIAFQSAFLKNDGTVVNTEGSDALAFFADPGDYYIIVHHRNHLSIMSNAAVSLSTSSTTTHDFTTGSIKYYGSNGAVEVGDDNWAMIAGDASGNNQIQNTDKNTFWKNQVGMSGYQSADFDLNGQVQNSDKNNLWKANVGSGSQVP